MAIALISTRGQVRRRAWRPKWGTMRSLLVTGMMFSLSAIGAFGEEYHKVGDAAFERTANEVADCIGQQAKPLISPGSPRISPDALDDFLKQKCGYLEEREEKEFLDFIRQQLRALAPKDQFPIYLAITAELTYVHTRGGQRRFIVDAYRFATSNRK